MTNRSSVPSVLFVCTGNICRSPTAHALLLHKAAARGLAVCVDSAAVSGEEVGNAPDRRALTELRRRGVSMPTHCARQVTADDFERFDYVLGMTAEHVDRLRRRVPTATGTIDLLMRYADGRGAIDVPDPWYGNAQDFIDAFDMIDAGVDGLIAHLMTATQ